MQRPDLAAFALAALAVVCATVLAVVGVETPDFIPAVALFALGGGTGVAMPNRGHGRVTDRVAA